MNYPSHLNKLMQILRRLPGVGLRTAERFAFQMLDWSPQQLRDAADTISSLKIKITTCDTCGCLCESDSCDFCTPKRAATKRLCVLAVAREVYAIEETGEYRGLYHVLGGVLSPMEGIGPDALRIDRLKKRVVTDHIEEIIIALDATLEGDATALYLKQELSDLPVSVSRLAFGLPMGSSLDYVDGGTLARALAGRSQF